MIIVRRVVGSSMKPALFAGDLVFARTRKKPQVGDIVIAKHKGREIIKRVDRLTKHKCYVTGDNKRASTDSRHYGMIAKSDIKAVAVFALGTSVFANRKSNKRTIAFAGILVISLAVLGFLVFGGYKKATSITNQATDTIAAIKQEKSLKFEQIKPSFPIGKVIKDMPYCNEQAMDIYYPRKATTAKAPVIIYIHGGAWENNNKTSDANVREMLEPLRDEGYAIVSIDYRKLPKYSFPAPVQDSLCSVRFLRAEQAKLGIDPQKIALFGFSSGGHLAGMVGTLDSNNQFIEGQAYPEQSSRVNAVVVLAGLLDFENALRNNNILRIRYFLKDATWRTAAPAAYVTPDDPPFLMIHGMKDQYVSPEQDNFFAQKLNNVGVENEIVHIENAEHGLGETGGKMSMSREQVAEKIRSFIKQKLQQ